MKKFTSTGNGIAVSVQYMSSGPVIQIGQLVAMHANKIMIRNDETGRLTGFFFEMQHNNETPVAVLTLHVITS